MTLIARHRSTAAISGISMALMLGWPSGELLAEPPTSLPDTYIHIKSVPEVQFQRNATICSIAFSQTSRSIAVADTKGGVAIWNLESHEAVWDGNTPSPGNAAVEELDLCFSDRGTMLVVASDLQPGMVWNCRDTDPSKRLPPLDTIVDEDYASAVAMTSWSGEEVAALRLSSNIIFWSLKTGKRVRTIEGAGQDVISLRIARNGKALATGTRSGRVIVRELPSGKSVFDIRASEYPIYAVGIDPDASCVIAGNDELVACWDVARKVRLWSTEGHCGFSGGVALSPSGNWLLTGQGTEKIVVQEVRTGKVVSSTSLRKDRWSAFAFNRDETLVATGSESGTIAVWKVNARQASSVNAPPNGKSTSHISK